jgi:hypothetical protein
MNFLQSMWEKYKNNDKWDGGFEKGIWKIVENFKIIVKLICLFISSSLKSVGERNEIGRLGRFISKCKKVIS